jgi:phosphomannomutase
MIPWLLVAQLMSVKNQTLSQLVGERIAKYPCSGEINFHVNDVKTSIAKVKTYFEGFEPTKIDTTDGLSMEFENWRFNLRGSNTEPVLRLNVESLQDSELVVSRTQEIAKILSM